MRTRSASDTAAIRAAADPAVLDGIIAAILDYAALVQEVETMRARLLAAGDGATPDELDALEVAVQIDLLTWKAETAAALRVWLDDATAPPRVH
jgi:hypothetical protein